MDNLVKENRINKFFINLRAQLKIIDLIPLLEFIDNSDIFPGLIKIAKYSNNPKAINMLTNMYKIHNKMDLNTDSGITFMKAIQEYESNVYNILFDYFDSVTYYKKDVTKKEFDRSGLIKTVYNKFNEIFTSYDLNSANFNMLKIMSCGNIPVNYSWNDICIKLIPESKEYPYFKQFMMENKELRQRVIGKILSYKSLMSQSDIMMENLVIELHKSFNTGAIVFQKDEIIFPGNHNPVKDNNLNNLIGFKRFCYTVTELDYAVKLEPFDNQSINNELLDFRIVCPDGRKLRNFMKKKME